MGEMTGFPLVLRQAKRGDPDALSVLYRSVIPGVLRFLRAREPGEADDLASEVWLDVAVGLSIFDGDERGFRAWAFTIARRRLIDVRRRRQRRPAIPMDATDIETTGPLGNAENEAIERLSTDEAIDRIRGLPDDQAEVVLLRIVADLDIATVAAIVGKRPGTVRVLQHRALRHLAKEFQRKV